MPFSGVLFKRVCVTKYIEENILCQPVLGAYKCLSVVIIKRYGFFIYSYKLTEKDQ